MKSLNVQDPLLSPKGSRSSSIHEVIKDWPVLHPPKDRNKVLTYFIVVCFSLTLYSSNNDLQLLMKIIPDRVQLTRFMAAAVVDGIDCHTLGKICQDCLLSGSLFIFQNTFLMSHSSMFSLFSLTTISCCCSCVRNLSF